MANKTKPLIITFAGIVLLLPPIICGLYWLYSCLYGPREYEIPEADLYLTCERKGHTEDGKCLFRIYLHPADTVTKDNYIEVNHTSTDMPNIVITRFIEGRGDTTHLGDTIYILDLYNNVEKIKAPNYNIVCPIRPYDGVYRSRANGNGVIRDSVLFYKLDDSIFTTKNKNVTIGMGSLLNWASIYLNGRETRFISYGLF